MGYPDGCADPAYHCLAPLSPSLIEVKDVHEPEAVPAAAFALTYPGHPTGRGQL